MAEGGSLLAHTAFEAHAARTPDAVAAVMNGSAITYGQLDRRANALAHDLATIGAGPESLVAVALPPSRDQMVALVAVLKAGAAYLPVDPGQPMARLRFLLEDARPAVLVAEPGHVRDIGVGPPALSVPRGERSDRPPARVRPGHLAYVIYTSGSTGRPKGVAMPHGPLANLLAWQTSPSGLGTRATRTLYRTPITFDVAFQELFGTWAAGGTVVVAGEQDRRDPRRLWDLIRRERVERVHLPFSLLQEMARAHPPWGDGEISLAEIVTAGERLVMTPDVRRLCADVPGLRLLNHYGPSETHVVTAHELTGQPGNWPDEPPIGQPIANVLVRLLTPELKLADSGEPGEICVGGQALFRGYLRQPGRTAERTVPDPWPAQPGALLYRTGDLGRYLPDGTLQFLGRVDDQVKIRGFRVEPGEVESRLSLHPGIQDCGVISRRNPNGTYDLIAYVVAQSHPPSVGALRDFIGEYLPDYMIPVRFFSVHALPRTSSGKLDRRSLSALSSARPLTAAPFSPPETPSEQALAGLWQMLLRVEPVGARDDFFELGGDSIRAMRLSTLAADRMAIDLPVATIFELRTVEALARYAASAPPAPSSAEPPLFPPRAIRNEARPSPAQEQLLALMAASPDAHAAYQETLAYWCDGRLDLEVLEEALSRVCRRQEALRARFSIEDGAFRMAIADDQRLPVVVDDMSRAPEADILRHAGRFAAEPIDLTAGPPVRVRVYRRSDDHHLLLLVVHHVMWDGWSVVVFERELRSAYERVTAGAVADDEDRPPRLLDVTSELRDRQDSPLVEEQLRRRRDALAFVPPVLSLPVRRQADSGTFGGRKASLRLDPAAARELSRMAAARGASMPMAVLALFATVLSRWSGQPSFLLGLVVRARPLAAMDDIIGFFANTIPIRIDVNGATTFGPLLARIRDEVLASIQTPEISLPRLASMLDPGRLSGQRPLVQVVFADQGEARTSWDADGLTFRPVAIHNGTAKFDLALELERNEDQWLVTLEYDSDLFTTATGRTVLTWLNDMAIAVTAAPDRPLLHGPGEPTPPTLVSIFTGQAARTPQRIALTVDGADLSYAELDATASRLARVLRSAGAGRGSRVGICLNRSADLIIAVLAALKTGCCYVPLDPDYPPARLRFIIADSGARLIITTPDLERLVSDTRARFVYPHATAPSSGDPLTCPVPGDAAYIIYTSGSTGTPKGVLVTHANVVQLFRASRPLFDFSEDDVWTMFHSAAFDFSVWEIWGALLHGGRLVMVPYAVSRSPEHFLRLVREQGVTVLNQTPSAFKQLAAVMPDSTAARSLRWLIFGGEKLEPRVLVPWFTSYGETVRVVNMYGITETTVHVSFHEIRETDLGHTGSPIGRPLPGVTVHLLDEDGAKVTDGAVGEMYVGGGGVSLGYAGNPRMTAERFIPDPSGPPGARLYRTGDLARRLPSGELDYISRADKQIKLHGHRIEPEEISATLAAHPGITSAAVISRTDSGTSRLVAYLVSADGEPSDDEISEWLRDRLPPYMIPAALVRIPALPLTPQGKLDEGKLPPPGRERPQLRQRYAAPRTDTERILAQAWEDTLQVSGIGRDDNFFRLGGDSITAIRAVAEAARLDVVTSVADITQHPTIAELAAITARAGTQADRVPDSQQDPFTLIDPAVAEILRAKVIDAYPMTALQIGMLYHSELEGDVTVYHDLIQCSIDGPPRESVIRRVLDSMTARHEVLRTAFSLGEYGTPLQLVFPSASIPLEIASGSLAALDEWREEETARTYDWATPPLMRCRFIRHDDSRFSIGLAVHHSVLDGWSIAQFIVEFLESYERFLSGDDRAYQTPRQPRYRDYVARELSDIANPRVAAYWQNVMASAAAPLELPARGTGGPSGLAGERLDPAVVRVLRQLASRSGVHLRSVMLAAHVKALAVLSGRSDITTGLVVNGRLEVPGGDQVLGLFLNTVPLKVTVRGESLSDLCTSVAAAEASLLPYRRYPLALMKRLSRSPMFDILFNYTHFHVVDRLSTMTQLKLTEWQTFEWTNFGLNVEVMASSGDQLEISCRYDGSRVTESQARIYLTVYIGLIQEITGD